MSRSVVTTWFGTFLVDGQEVLRAERAPLDPVALADRARLRRSGSLTPEEDHLLEGRAAEAWLTGDRRLADRGLRLDLRGSAAAPSALAPADREPLRAALLEEGERALRAAWDPSIHVEEAVRAASDLDRVRNLVGERLGSWVSRDVPELDPGDHAQAARRVLEGSHQFPLGPTDPSLLQARRRLAELYRSVEAAQAELSAAVSAAVPRKTPNLSALLGPELTGRMLAQAGGLERLARLPASTIQVLGAERAFFEHLRGHAPPPRHGLLFLHPAIQSRPRGERGKLARTLAGKVAIAARLDRAGSPVDPSLLRLFEARRTALRAVRSPGRRGGSSRRSAEPLHRASDDR